MENNEELSSKFQRPGVGARLPNKVKAARPNKKNKNISHGVEVDREV